MRFLSVLMKHLFNPCSIRIHSRQCEEVKNRFLKFKDYSTSAKSLKDSKKDDSPITFSTSPLKSYKASTTFAGRKLDKEPSAKPMIIGGAMLLVLISLMAFGRGKRFDPFSTEAYEKIQAKLALDLANTSGTNETESGNSNLDGNGTDAVDPNRRDEERSS